MQMESGASVMGKLEAEKAQLRAVCPSVQKLIELPNTLDNQKKLIKYVGKSCIMVSVLSVCLSVCQDVLSFLR